MYEKGKINLNKFCFSIVFLSRTHTLTPPVYTVTAQKAIDLSKHAYGQLYYLNYPQTLPYEVDFTQHLIAPVGTNILLELHGVGFSKDGCQHGGSIEISDNYADSNGTTWWELCDIADISNLFFKEIGRKKAATDGGRKLVANEALAYAGSPIQIRSYLNTIQVRQKIKGLLGAKLNATVFIQPGKFDF